MSEEPTIPEAPVEAAPPPEVAPAPVEPAPPVAPPGEPAPAPVPRAESQTGAPVPEKPPKEDPKPNVSNVSFNKTADAGGLGDASKPNIVKAEASQSGRRDSKNRDGLHRWSSGSRTGGRSKIGIGSILSIKRGSYTDYAERQKVIRYANTYKLESDKTFNVDRVENIIKQVLHETLEEMTYDAEQCAMKAKLACGTIRDKIKEENYDRYKIVCLVTIGEKKSQDQVSVIKFLWDCERDHYAHYFQENMYVFIAAVVFGIYFE